MFSRSGNPLLIFSTELPCLSDLENPGRLPVQHVLGGTGECVLKIFEISWLFMFLRSENPMWHFYRATCFGWPRKSRSTTVRFKGKSTVLMIVSYRFLQFLHYSLCQVKESFGITGLAHHWIRSILTSWTQTVHVGTSTSSAAHVRWGVPQGSVLGPLL